MAFRNKKGDGTKRTISETDKSLNYNQIQIVTGFSDFLRRNSGLF